MYWTGHWFWFLLKFNLFVDFFKGQLISEWIFDALNFPKNNNKIFWQISALESKKWSNHKIKALPNVFNTLNSKFDHIYYMKVPLSYDLTTF